MVRSTPGARMTEVKSSQVKSSQDIQDRISYATFGDDPLRALGVARGRISGFPIDLRRRPYNTLPLPCKCVLDNFWNTIIWIFRWIHTVFKASAFNPRNSNTGWIETSSAVCCGSEWRMNSRTHVLLDTGRWLTIILLPESALKFTHQNNTSCSSIAMTATDNNSFKASKCKTDVRYTNHNNYLLLRLHSNITSLMIILHDQVVTLRVSTVESS